MKKLFAVGVVVIAAATAALSLFYFRFNDRNERLHYEREETELIISNSARAHLTLFKAGKNLQDAAPMPAIDGEQTWLPAGNYFLKVDDGTRTFFYPAPMLNYRGGPDKDGTFGVTIRMPVSDPPHGLRPDLPDYVFVPSGHFLFGDKLNRQEPHYVWLGGFVINPFEVTNEEFLEFWKDPKGYRDDANWTEAGKTWKAANSSNATALLKPTDGDYKRFGQPDQPVVQVNWFEANAFCRWLTKTVGRGTWIFGLPSEAEWEKVARGPDNFDYALGMNISDREVGLYNWKKNPGAEITVVGLTETRSQYSANRYGVYHMTGNVAEWTQSIYRPYNRQRPYVDDDDRNHDDVSGERVIRGGSWYTASVAVLYIPYRENFRPEVRAPYLGFRVVARPVP
jgi:iron(II)-dependent oxidoreductase